MAIKNYNTCKGCFYGAFNQHCETCDCTDCPMFNGNSEIYHETVLCKCNTVEVDTECKYYKPLED